MDTAFMAVGKIKFFSEDKGFGFLKVEGSADVFLHSNELKRGGIKDIPKPGDQFGFEPEDSAKGLKALKVYRV